MVLEPVCPPVRELMKEEEKLPVDEPEVLLPVEEPGGGGGGLWLVFDPQLLVQELVGITLPISC